VKKYRASIKMCIGINMTLTLLCIPTIAIRGAASDFGADGSSQFSL